MGIGLGVRSTEMGEKGWIAGARGEGQGRQTRQSQMSRERESKISGIHVWKWDGR